MINSKIMALLDEQSLFKTVQILGTKYTVIYRNGNDCAVIKTTDEVDNVMTIFVKGTLWIPCRIYKTTLEIRIGNMDAAVTYSELNMPKHKDNCLVIQAVKWYDHPESPYLFLCIPHEMEMSEKDVEEASFCFFVDHIGEDENRLGYWRKLQSFK